MAAKRADNSNAKKNRLRPTPLTVEELMQVLEGYFTEMRSRDIRDLLKDMVQNVKLWA